MTVGLRAEVEWQAVILEKVLEYVRVQECRVVTEKRDSYPS